MIVRRRLVDGGILAIKVINNDMRIPYQIQLAEVDELEGPAALRSPQGNAIVGGIEVSDAGKPLSYYLRKIALKLSCNWNRNVSKRNEFISWLIIAGQVKCGK